MAAVGNKDDRYCVKPTEVMWANRNRESYDEPSQHQPVVIKHMEAAATATYQCGIVTTFLGETSVIYGCCEVYFVSCRLNVHNGGR